MWSVNLVICSSFLMHSCDHTVEGTAVKSQINLPEIAGEAGQRQEDSWRVTAGWIGKIIKR